MKHIYLVIVLMTLFSFCSTAQSYNIVLATDFDGNVISGSKEILIQLIRQGKPVRVGWQLDFNEDKKSDFDHWVDASFITILENEVFTQIEPIFMQGPNLDGPQVDIYPSNTQWTGLIGTNGKLLNRYLMDNEARPKLVFDETLDISEEEQKQQIEALEKKLQTMKEVKTWNVATFWSVQK